MSGTSPYVKGKEMDVMWSLPYMVIHIYNPSCSQGRDLEDYSSRPTQAKS
jgi:hypothetical protein